MKGDRKRVEKLEVKKPVLDVAPINTVETTAVQNLFNISNGYAKLKQQYAEYSLIVKGLNARRKDIQEGIIELPILMPLSRNKFYSCNDKVTVLKEIDSELKVMQDALKGVEGQMLQNRDAFIEAGLAVHEWAAKRFSGYKPKNVYSAGCSPSAKEEILFEGELEDILKDEGTKKKFKDATKEATKRNESLGP
jgi:hypothetical protein